MACRAVVLEFPVKASCPCCGRTCNEEDLSECYTCGEKFCGSAKSDCKSICACDRLTADLAARWTIMKPRSRVLMLAESVKDRVKAYLRFSEL